jgi:hypothetical protein
MVCGWVEKGEERRKKNNERRRQQTTETVETLLAVLGCEKRLANFFFLLPCLVGIK